MSMLKGDELRAEMSRRAFLSYGVALGAMSIAAPSLLATGARAATADGEVLTGSHWGAFRAKVEGGRVVSVKPWEKDPAPSHQLAGVLDSIYSPTRIKYPMVRRAYLEKGPGADVDSHQLQDPLHSGTHFQRVGIRVAEPGLRPVLVDDRLLDGNLRNGGRLGEGITLSLNPVQRCRLLGGDLRKLQVQIGVEAVPDEFLLYRCLEA